MLGEMFSLNVKQGGKGMKFFLAIGLMAGTKKSLELEV